MAHFHQWDLNLALVIGFLHDPHIVDYHTQHFSGKPSTRSNVVGDESRSFVMTERKQPGLLIPVYVFVEVRVR